MLFRFDARIGNVVDFHIQAKHLAGLLDFVRQFQNGEMLRKLVVDLAFAAPGRVQARQLHTTDGIPDIEEAARLAALSIYREGLADGSLYTEAVEHRAEDIVVV